LTTLPQIFCQKNPIVQIAKMRKCKKIFSKSEFALNLSTGSVECIVDKPAEKILPDFEVFSAQIPQMMQKRYVSFP